MRIKWTLSNRLLLYAIQDILHTIKHKYVTPQRKSTTMNIVYDHQIFGIQEYGGVSRYYYEIANRIAAAKNEVEIFAPLFVNRYFNNESIISPQGIKIPHLPAIIRSITNLVNVPLSYLLVKQRRHVDIFHETYYHTIDCCPHSAKRVITVHDMIHEKFPHYFPYRDTTRKNKARAVHRAHHIICVSENTRRDLVELLNVPQEKTSVVYHGYSISCDINSVKPPYHEKPFILYVGSRDSYKNFDLLLRAFASSKLLRNEFSIICFGGGKASAREKELLSTLDLPYDCVKYIDGNDPVLAGLYASAKAFVYPSLYEGFGIPPLEAMAFGCPVICSNTSSIPEVVGDAAHLFNPTKTADLLAAIEAVVCSSEYSALLKSKGYERIKFFSWDKCANDTLGVYEKVSGMNR